MPPPSGDRAHGRDRELTAYLVVGDLVAARRIAARSVAETDLADLLLREPGSAGGPDPARRAGLPPREIAFWWWLRGLPARDRVALVMATRHGWAYDDGLASLLDEAAAVLGSSVQGAAGAVTAALDRRLGALPPEPAIGPDLGGRGRWWRGAGAIAASLVVAAGVTVLADSPATSPAEAPPARLLPRPLARPLANYENLAAVPGRHWDLPERGEGRAAPPWARSPR